VRLAGIRAFSAFREDALDVSAHAVVAHLHLLMSSTGLFRRLGRVNHLLLANHLCSISVCGKMPDALCNPVAECSTKDNDGTRPGEDLMPLSWVTALNNQGADAA
jgi:hypothetical protein